MVSQAIYRAEDAIPAIEAELLEVLLQPAEACYPWNPADPASEVALDALAQEWEALGMEDWEVSTQAEALYHSFEQSFSRSNRVSLLEQLKGNFASRIPLSWLESIAKNAQAAIAQSESLADRLITSVQELLPQWDVDDLQVLARPYAYAMRDVETPETISHVRNASWEELSETEQARLSLAIARYALHQLSQTQP